MDPSAEQLDKAQLRRILSEPKFFHLLFDALPLQVAVKSTRPETFGQFLLWNRVAEEWLGLKAEEVIGRTDYDFFPREQAEFFLAKDRELVERGERVEIPSEVISSRTRGERLIHTVKTPIFDEEGRPLALLAVSEDITDRERASRERDEALRQICEERNLFQALLDHLPVCAFAKSLRPENLGAYILWNRVMENLHGRKAADVLGHKAEDAFDARTAAVFARQDQKIVETGEVMNIPLQAVEYGRAGRRLMHTIKAPVYAVDGSPLAIIGVSEDITERIQSDAERTHAMEMLRQLNSRVPGAIYQLRITESGQRAFTYLGERAEEISGYPAAEFLRDYEAAQRCILEEDREVVAAAEARATEHGGLFQCEFRIRARNGAVRWVESSASRQMMSDGSAVWSGFLMDISERKRAEAALREGEERWQLALAASEAGVWDWDIQSARVFYSDRWRQMFGYEGEKLPETPQELLRLIHPEDRAQVRALTLAHLRGKTDIFRCEYRMVRRSGDYLWILAHAKAHFNEENKPTRLIGTLIDITERKGVEEELIEAKNAAESASRAKSDFLAMMSHEIRTPLNGVLGFAELLAGTPLDSAQGEYLETIRESGSNLLHILNDILDFSKIESGKLQLDNQAVVLRELVPSAADTFRARAESKKLALTVEVAPEVPPIVKVDPVRLRQILGNLISNAVKFTSEGSVKVVLTSRAAPAGGIAALRLTVVDTGIGIRPEDQPLLFEPFQQLDATMSRRFGGTGLGLAIVHRLVTLMNGCISVASEQGKGTTFTIDLDLPLVSTSTPTDGVFSASVPTAARARAMSVLIVEDNNVNRRLASLMLERLGYAFHEAEDGAKAVDLASRHAYDVILMDLQMPVMDGYEAARRIREISPRTNVIALTAHALASDRERSLACGMRAHLTKPIRLDELREVLAVCSTEALQNGAPA